MQENLIRDDNKLILLASLSDSLEYVADSIERQVGHYHTCSFTKNAMAYMRYIFHAINRLGKACTRAANQVEENNNQKNPHHARMSSAPPKDLVSFAEEYRKLAIDCLKVLRVEMQLETIFNLQVCESVLVHMNFFPLMKVYCYS